jgi:nucleotide-binding universal stress UspA family protein
METEAETDRRIVVGVDGSEASRVALRWAMAEARLRAASVHVVHAWQFPAVALTSFGSVTLPMFTAEDLERVADGLMRKTIANVVGPDEPVEVTTSVERGHPAEVLVAAAKGAELVVVGSSGYGAFATMLLGSVSNHVAHHATCPVVIVRGEGR